MDTDHRIEKKTTPFILPEDKRNIKELLRFLNKFQSAKIKLGYPNYQKMESRSEQLLQRISKMTDQQSKE